MTLHFLDTSAWVKLYVREPGSGWLRRWYRAMPTVIVSSLSVVELLSAFARRRTDGSLTTTRFEQLYRSAISDATRHTIVHLGGRTLEFSLELPRRTTLRGADTVQLASLLSIRANLDEENDLALVCSDRSLNEHAAREGVRILDPVNEET